MQTPIYLLVYDVPKTPDLGVYCFILKNHPWGLIFGAWRPRGGRLDLREISTYTLKFLKIPNTTRLSGTTYASSYNHPKKSRVKIKLDNFYVCVILILS